ncbi:MAG: preprotein translocase subunit SecG, partial [Planctomycetes bacterium]|nr:preprotein translocase subunit SecG [Planctomycetota bacterium]
MVTVFVILFVLICPLIVFIVLIQEPKGGGLAGVLGGAGGTSAFGAKTADVVMKTTVVLGVIYFFLALTLGIKLRQAPGGPGTSLSPASSTAAETPSAAQPAPAEGGAQPAGEPAGAASGA